jgi:hypothetical protein
LRLKAGCGDPERGLQGILHDRLLQRREKELVKGSADVGVHRVVTIDVAEIDHLLLDIDRIAGQCLFRRLDFDLAQCARFRLRQRQVSRIGARQFDGGRVEDGGERLNVDRMIGWRIRVRDIGGDSRLARGQPLRLL